MTVVGRLAPTPSGDLHLGNVVSFLACWLSARSQGGRVLLRVEDVDRGRARADVAQRQRDDLQWLGLVWDEEVAAQSERDYGPWLSALGDATYACTCTRRMVAESGGVYRGTCRAAGHKSGKVRFRLPSETRCIHDERFGPIEVDLTTAGDPVLRRADGVFTYPLAVVADDIADGVTEVVRGADLLEQSAVQEVLWEALSATPPRWLHAPLVLGADGRKLAKSSRSLHLGALRECGWTSRDVLQQVLPWLGLPGVSTLPAAVGAFDPTASLAPRIQLTLPLNAGCPSPTERLDCTIAPGDQP